MEQPLLSSVFIPQRQWRILSADPIVHIYASVSENGKEQVLPHYVLLLRIDASYFIIALGRFPDSV